MHELLRRYDATTKIIRISEVRLIDRMIKDSIKEFVKDETLSCENQFLVRLQPLFFEELLSQE